MSTRARIGILREGRKVESVYSHSDGYIDYLGSLLYLHYSEPAKIEALIELGDLSIVREKIGEDQGPEWFDKWYEEIGNAGDDPRRSWTLAYQRDRGEQNCSSSTHPLEDWPDSGQEYEYLYRPAECDWLVRTPAANPFGWGDMTWLKLADALERPAIIEEAGAEREEVTL